MEPAAIPLEALSVRQRRRVNGHLPLVGRTLRRHNFGCAPYRLGRETGELFQEGCVALVEAVRRHDPHLHGEFASYAMARIHYAMSLYLHENDSMIRVPFSSQRRARRRADDRHNPNGPRRVAVTNDAPRRRRDIYASAQHEPQNENYPTAGDVIRQRCEEAMREVVAEMKHAPRCQADNAAVVDRCLTERWSVPNPENRMPVRQLAKALSCSLGRITHCEERFHRRVAAVLTKDEIFTTVQAMARRSPIGMKLALSPEDLQRICGEGANEADQ